MCKVTLKMQQGEISRVAISQLPVAFLQNDYIDTKYLLSNK